MTHLWYWLFIVGGFLSGSVMYGKFLPLLLCKKDVCALADDHNPGAGNVFAFCGIPLGMLCLTLDLAKGFLPVYLCVKWLGSDSYWFTLVMCAPVVGHAVGLTNKFHGGKAIATSFGVTIGVATVAWQPLVILAVCYVALCLLVPIHPNRIKSIITYLIFALVCLHWASFTHEWIVAWSCVLIAVTVILRHSRLLANVPDDEVVAIGSHPIPWFKRI